MLTIQRNEYHAVVLFFLGKDRTLFRLRITLFRCSFEMISQLVLVISVRALKKGKMGAHRIVFFPSGSLSDYLEDF